MNYFSSNFHLPRPQRLYPWIRSYPKRFSIDVVKVTEILSAYDLRLVGRPKPPSGGVRNTSIIVDTSGGKKLLKIYRESLGQSTIIQEHSILRYLAEVNFPAPRLEKTKSGQTLVEQGKKRYVLFRLVENGFRLYDYITFPNQARRYISIAGQTLAILHSKLMDFVPEGYNPDGFKSKTGDRWRNNQWFLDKLKFCVKRTLMQSEIKADNIVSKLLERASDFENILTHFDANLTGTDLPRQIIHKDYGPSNLLFRKDAPPVVIDFEISRLDWRIVDIISAWQGFCRTKSGYDLKKMKCFLDAYQSRMLLSSAEVKFFPVVWELLQIKGCINYWHRYCLSGDRTFLVKAGHKMQGLDWLKANEDSFLSSLGLGMPKH